MTERKSLAQTPEAASDITGEYPTLPSDTATPNNHPAPAPLTVPPGNDNLGTMSFSPAKDGTQKPAARPARITSVGNPAVTSPATSLPGPLGTLPVRVGNYDVLEEIARGGMGVVYKARQLGLERMVALKVVISHDHLSQTNLERFDREARAAAALDHPDIVPVFDHGNFNGYPYFAMALVEGPSLATLVKQQGILPQKQAVAIMIRIAEAIAHAHGKGILHRDLKPENVLLDANGRPRVTDFGLAKRVSDDHRLTVPGQILGTPSYMAPEQALGKDEQGPATDIWALGGILYFLLTGRAPFAGKTVTETLLLLMTEPPTPPSSVSKDVPPDLEAICLKCLQKEPHDRFASVQELVDALQAYSWTTWGDSRSGELSTLSKVSLPGKRNRSRFVMQGVAAGLVGVLIMGTVLAVRSLVVKPEKETGKTEVAQATGTTGTTEPKRPAVPVDLQHDFDLQVKMNGGVVAQDGKQMLTEGDRVTFEVTCARDAYVGIWSIQADGKIIQLFPNDLEPSGFVKAGERRSVPGKPGYSIKATPASVSELVHVAASTKPWSPLEGQRIGPFVVHDTRLGDRMAARGQLRGLYIDVNTQEERQAMGAAVAEAKIEYMVKEKPKANPGAQIPLPYWMWPVALAIGQTPPSELSPRDAMNLAEDKYRAGDLFTAEPLYRRALKSTAADIQQTCYDRLLDIYPRLLRHDKVVEVGLEYQDWLTRRRDMTRESQVSLQLGKSYLALGHYKLANAALERALESRPALLPLPRLAALTALARSAERTRDKERASRYWGEVRTLALDILTTSGEQLVSEERIECVWNLSDAYRSQGKSREAIVQLNGLLKRFESDADLPAKRDTLSRLANHYEDQHEYGSAEKALRTALTLQERLDKTDHLHTGDLLRDLARCLAKQRKPTEALKVRDEAVNAYRAAWNTRSSTPNHIRVAAAFWRLQQLYQSTNELKNALKLSETQVADWINQPLVRPRAQVEEGSLQVALGDYEAAAKPLRNAIADLEKQTPLPLSDLPPALYCLAMVEQATGHTAKAEELGKRCLALYEGHNLPTDSTLIETYSLLGTVAALNGQRKEAVDRFREGEKLCASLPDGGKRQLCNLQLNLALLHKAQGEHTRALELCENAYKVFTSFADPEDLSNAGFHAALADLYVGRREFDKVTEHAHALQKLCTKYSITSGPLVVTYKHSLALDRLYKRDFATAEKLWREAENLQKDQPLVLPRTLNWLGIAAQLQGNLDDAEKYLSRACDIQKNSPGRLASTYYISLWRLAKIRFKQKKPTEARVLLEQAVEVVEVERLRLYGDSKQRAIFFAQFEGAIEDLVDSCVDDGLIAEACQYAARGRSRALLDQFYLAGDDPRNHLTGAKGEQLKKQEAELRQSISAMRMRAQMMPLEDAGKAEAKKLASELMQAEQDYAKVWREVLNASPIYRNLAATEKLKETLGTIRKKALTDKKGLLLYWIGRNKSYAFLVGPEKQSPSVYRLEITSESVTKLAALNRKPEIVQAASRGLGFAYPAIELPPPNKPSVTLTRAQTWALVDTYRHAIQTSDFQARRGLVIDVDSVVPAAPTEELPVEIPGAVFLPLKLRAQLKKLGLAELIVIPDGALHKLPLEGLVLKGGINPVYAVDELPPLVYAPSAAGLAYLLERPQQKTPKTLSLLTVGDVAYPRDPKTPVPKDHKTRQTLATLRAQLERLDHTREESQRIRSQFAPEAVEAIVGKNATEQQVVDAMKGKQIIHLAVHGFAQEGEGQENLFAALAFTAPDPRMKPASANDGFLSLLEIYQLPLQSCELAVLSACVTNIGPEAPLEAGVTLANAFLTAGARRVVGSHWYVNDQSTALLMEAFFKEATGKDGKRVPYAVALQKARLELRRNPKWSSPNYWAPFVILGTGD